MKCKAMKNEKSLLQSCNRLMGNIILSNRSVLSNLIIPNFPSVLNIIQSSFFNSEALCASRS